MPRHPHPRLSLCAHEYTEHAHSQTARQHTRGLTLTTGHSHRPPRSKMLRGPRYVPPRCFVWEEALGLCPSLAWTSTPSPHTPSGASLPGGT